MSVGQEATRVKTAAVGLRRFQAVRAWVAVVSRDRERITLALLTVLASVGAGAVVHALAVHASADALPVTAVFVGLGVVPLAFRFGGSVVAVVALVAAWLVAVVLIKYLPDVINPEPSVAQAVGAAAFFNTPYRGPQIGAVLSLAIPILVALGSVVPTLRRQTVAGASSPAADAVQPPVWLGSTSWRLAGLWLGVALLALTLVPDLRTAANGLNYPQPYGWDSANGFAWQAFQQMGLVPMKDFFFPYGFQWLYGLRNVGALLQWGAQIAMLGIAAWSLWRLTGGRAWRVLLCLLAVVLAATWNSQAWRYLPSMLIVTTYAALGPARHARLVRGHIAFAAACLLAVFLEPDLLAIGVFGAIMVALGELVGGRVAWRPRELIRCLAVDAIPVLGAALAIVLVWVASGTTSGNLHFYGEFTAVSAQSAMDENLLGPLGLMVLNPDTYSLAAAVPALLAAAGFVWARLRPGAEPAVAAILLGASGVALALVLKHLVRQVTFEVLIIPLIALAWVAIITWRERVLLRAVASGAALGALLTLVNSQHGVSDYFSSVFDSPNHALRSAAFLTDYKARVKAGKARFSEARFTNWPDDLAVGYYAQAVPMRPLPPFAVIGDLQMTYVLLRQRPPYQINLYDAGRINEQRTMLGLLKRRPPPYLIWRQDYVQDGFPYDVRDPLIFTWMVANYVPVREFRTAGSPTQGTSLSQALTVDILRHRAPGERAATRYWLRKFGPGLGLGYIPSLSTAARSGTCSRGSGCVPYVVMHGRAAGSGKLIGLTVRSGRITYSVTFLSRGDVSEYPIRLDRLWFWPLLGPNPTIASVTPGFTAQTVSLSSGDNLY